MHAYLHHFILFNKAGAAVNIIHSMINLNTINIHLKEIKVRCFYIMVSWLVCLCCCYINKTQILYLIIRPNYAWYKPIISLNLVVTRPINSSGLHGETNRLCNGFISDDRVSMSYPNFDFIYTNVTEAFYTTLQACVFISILFTLPIIAYHSWCFLMPSFYKTERCKYNKHIVLFYAYILFSFFLIVFGLLPYMVKFLYQFSVTTGRLHIINQPRISKYVSWIVYSLCTSVFVSLTPLFLYMMLKKGFIKIDTLCNKRKQAALCMLMVAALICPPDPVSQSLLSMHFFVLYESVVWIYIYNTHNNLLQKTDSKNPRTLTHVDNCTKNM